MACYYCIWKMDIEASLQYRKQGSQIVCHILLVECRIRIPLLFTMAWFIWFDVGSSQANPFCVVSLIAMMNEKPSSGYLSNSRRSSGAGSDAVVISEIREDYASVRCKSLPIEQTETRRRKSKSKFPGLALGASLMKSPAEMKYQIIGNELHNIINVHMKRVRSSCSWLMP